MSLDRIADRLRTIWCDAIGPCEITDSNNFVELGGDSIAASTCLNRIQAAFGVEIGLLSLLGEDADFGSLVREVANLAGSTDYAGTATAVNSMPSPIE